MASDRTKIGIQQSQKGKLRSAEISILIPLVQFTMKILFVSLLAGSAQGILAADADTDANADAGVPAASLRRRGTATNHANRRTNGYWAAPISDSGLTCIDNSIRAGGDKPVEICMTEGDALCIEYDHKPMGGRWQFGIKDSRLLLYDPKGDVAWEYCRDVTHLCIGEEHGFVPNRYSQERPYMTMYDEKSHEVVGSLTCDGTDGQDDKNLGQSTILKLVDQAVVGPYADYHLPIVKLRKGQTEDPEDDNSLWDIEYDPNEPHQRLWWENLADFDATFSYNQGKCEWTDLCPTNTPSSTPSVSFVPTTFCDYGDRVGTFRELKEQIDEATDPDPANRATIEICSDKPIVFDSIVDISDKYFKIECLGGSGCVFDLDGYSFVTTWPTGADFDVEFKGITIENGSSSKGRDPALYTPEDGGAILLRGNAPLGIKPENSTLTLTSCTFRNNTATSDSGAIDNFGATIIATDTTFSNNLSGGIGGAIWSNGFATFVGCDFIGNIAFDAGAIVTDGLAAYFDNCKFIGNTATGGASPGGAIWSTVDTTVQSSLFKCNSADLGGAIFQNFDAKLSMNDVEVVANTAQLGGGVYLTGSGAIAPDNCRFYQNTANVGGAIYFDTYRLNPNHPSTLTGTVFQSNSAIGSDDIYNSSPSTVACSGNCFCDANNSNGISTNDLPTTCAGDGVGSTCPGCNPPAAPIVCDGDNGSLGTATGVVTSAGDNSTPTMDMGEKLENLMEMIERKRSDQSRRH